MSVSRRSLLMQGTALLIVSQFTKKLAAADETAEISVGYVGENIVQITIIDTLFDVPDTLPVSSDDYVEWIPDPYNQFGSVGKLNGISGNFSGDSNVSQPQLFQEWPKVVKDTRLWGFRQGNEEYQKQAPADQPEKWRISIDGEPAVILSLFRKSVPIKTLAVGVRRWESTKRHHLTFELNLKIPEDAIVRLEGPSVSKIEHRRSSVSFSENIHVCQAGYPLIGTKKAYVGSWWGQDRSGVAGNTDAFVSEQTKWSVISEQNGNSVQSGNLSRIKPANEPHRERVNYNGCDIYEADFSELNLNGTFRLQIEGFGCSFPFNISQNPYENALRLAARWYFHQRSGCEISEPFGEGRSRPRNGHPDDGLITWQTNIKLGDTREGFGKIPPGKLLSQLLAPKEKSKGVPNPSSLVSNPNAWGGWHDAGDWDRRIQHMDVVYHLANLVEAFEHTRDLNLNLPETGKSFSHPDVKARKNHDDRGDGQTVLPDLVHEALWGISLWRRTQGDDGDVIGGIEYSNSGIQGSVSWNPVQIAFAYGPEEWAAYRFALGAAKLGHVVKNVCGDAILGEALVGEASRAWHWAEKEPLSKRFSPSEATNRLSDAKEVVSRARIASAAAVYRASGDDNAREVFESHNPFFPLSTDPESGIKKGIFSHANLEYVHAYREGRPANSDIVTAIEKWVKYRAESLTRKAGDFGLHSIESYPWGRGWMRFGPGSNWPASHFAMYFSSMKKMLPEMQRSALEGMWFGLGCNPSNVSFVQGLGHRDFSDPLLTDQIGSSNIPGQISFGVTGGNMHPWELRKTSGSIYPVNQDDWPKFTQIFESRSIAISSEHGVKSNALQWLIACAVATSF